MALFWHLDLGREGGLRQCRRGSPLLLCTYPTLNVRSLRRAIRHCSLKWLSCFGLMLERVAVCSRSDHCSSLVSDGHHKPPLFVIHTWNSENDRSVWSSVLELSFFFAVRSRSQCVCVCVNLDSNACVGLFEWGTTTKSADELVVLKFVPCKKSGIPSQNGRFKLSLPVMLVRIDNIQLLSTRTFINTFLCGCVFVYLIYIFMYMRWNWWASEACKFLYEAARVVVFSKFNLALKLNFFFNTTRDLTSKCSDQ